MTLDKVSANWAKPALKTVAVLEADAPRRSVLGVEWRDRDELPRCRDEERRRFEGRSLDPRCRLRDLLCVLDDVSPSILLSIRQPKFPFSILYKSDIAV